MASPSVSPSPSSTTEEVIAEITEVIIATEEEPENVSNDDSMDKDLCALLGDSELDCEVESDNGDSEEEALESGCGFSAEHCCSICEERYSHPRVLPCLHSFCSACLEKEISENSPATAQERLTQALAPCPGTITCPSCKQETRLGSKGIGELPLDYVMMNMLDMAAIAERQIICTSCKAKDKAVARCSDCANFLCPNCVTAHQYMRCFESHKVFFWKYLISFLVATAFSSVTT